MGHSNVSAACLPVVVRTVPIGTPRAWESASISLSNPAGAGKRVASRRSPAVSDWGDAAHRAGEWSKAELVFQPIHDLTQRRLRHSEPPRSTREAAVGGDCHKDREVAELIRAP